MHVHRLLNEGWEAIQAFGESLANYLEPLPTIVSPVERLPVGSVPDTTMKQLCEEHYPH